MHRPEFSVDVEDGAIPMLVRLRGELDLATVPLVHRAVAGRSTGQRAVIVDLSGLEFMDSSGLKLLLDLQNRPDLDVRFTVPGPRVSRVIDMTGVRPSLRWVDEPEAVGGLTA